MQVLRAVGVALAGLLFAAPAFAITITNPGFEAGSAGTALVIPGWTSIDTPDIAAPGGLDIGPGLFDLAAGMPASPDAGQFALLRNSPLTFGPEGVSQTISGLTPSVTYTVSFFQAIGGSDGLCCGHVDETGPGHWEVTFAGVTQSASTMTFMKPVC